MSSQYTYLIEQGIKAGKEKNISDACVYDVVFSHNQRDGNYEWLQPEYGKLLWVDFYEEKYGKWITYDVYWWTRHGSVVNHSPDKLVEDHVKWYVDPETKKIELRFWFQLPNGIVYATPPTRHFYELERDYFIRHHLCNKDPAKYQPKYDPYKAPGPNYLYK